MPYPVSVFPNRFFVTKKAANAKKHGMYFLYIKIYYVIKQSLLLAKKRLRGRQGANRVKRGAKVVAKDLRSKTFSADIPP